MDRAKYAKVLKQLIWNKPVFSPEGFFLTVFNLDKNDEGSFYHKEELAILDFNWITAKDENYLLLEAKNPLELVSPAVVSRESGKWVANKEQASQARERLESTKLIAIQLDKEKDVLGRIIASLLFQEKAALSGNFLIPKELTEDLLESVKACLSGLKGKTKIFSPVGLLTVLPDFNWESVVFTPPTTETGKRNSTRTSQSPQAKLNLIRELLQSKEMEEFVLEMSKMGLSLNKRSLFYLAFELVTGFNTMAVVEVDKNKQ